MTTPDERPDPPPQQPAERPPIVHPSLEHRADAFGREVEAAATRFASNPEVRAAGDIAARLWGLVLLAVGSWFLARVTLRLAVPDVAWGELWPIALIGLGLIVIASAGRRR